VQPDALDPSDPNEAPLLLLVDDDEDLLSLLTKFFRNHAHTVSGAENGAAMFAVLEQQPIDLVILDVMLQEEDGFSLCRQLRARSPVPVRHGGSHALTLPSANCARRTTCWYGSLEANSICCWPLPNMLSEF